MLTNACEILARCLLYAWEMRRKCDATPVQGSNVFKALVGLRVIVANGVFGLVELVGYIARGKDDL